MLDSLSLAAGVPLVVGGCASNSIGLALMKRSGQVEADLPVYCAWRWCCGFFCLAIVQTACDALSLTLLPLSVVAPFAGLTIVFSLLIVAVGGCGAEVAEVLSRADLLGAACVLIGVSCVASSASHSSPQPLTVERAAAALLAPAFALPALLTLLGTTSCLLIPRLLGARRVCPAALCACGAAACGAFSQINIKMLSLATQTYFHSAGVGERLAAASGAVEPLVNGSESESEAATARMLALSSLLGLAITAPSQLSLLTSALDARASLVVPLYQFCLVTLTTAVGGLTFHEFDALRPSDGWMYAGGALVATAGLLVLSRGGMDTYVSIDGEEPRLEDSHSRMLGGTEAEEGCEQATTRLRAPLLTGRDAGAREASAAPDDALGEAPRDSDGDGAAERPLSMVRRRRSSVTRLPAPLMLGLGVVVMESMQQRADAGRPRSRSLNAVAVSGAPRCSPSAGDSVVPLVEARQRSRSTLS